MNGKTDNGDRKHPNLCKTLKLLEERESMFLRTLRFVVCARFAWSRSSSSSSLLPLLKERWRRSIYRSIDGNGVTEVVSFVYFFPLFSGGFFIMSFFFLHPGGREEERDQERGDRQEGGCEVYQVWCLWGDCEAAFSSSEEEAGQNCSKKGLALMYVFSCLFLLFSSPVLCCHKTERKKERSARSVIHYYFQKRRGRRLRQFLDLCKNPNLLSLAAR